ncbi:MAG TPA: diacylglycerol kinase family protein [Polyangiaceae bacterium]|nr:diacylglycerol kinase family protein [Polyangiaceae bacterium]
MSTALRPLAVVNPRSGGGRCGRTAAQTRSVVERSLGPIDLVFTEAPGHAVDLAHDACARGREVVIAIGGDGTMHEVANGVLEAGGATAVGYVGQGTGGDFRRTLGLTHRLDAYVAALGRGTRRLVDVGRVRYRAPDGSTRTRWFVNVLSVGMGGLVDDYVSRTSKALGGRAAYFWASARALVRCRRARLRCDVGLGGDRGEQRLESLMMAVCNGRYFGGGMHVAPMAEPDDGRFEVVSLDAPTKLAFALGSRHIYEGRHLESPGARHFGCDHIKVALEDESVRDHFLLDVDGEPLGGLPVEVDLVPRALTVLV